jgi:hypothetical protein
MCIFFEDILQKMKFFSYGYNMSSIKLSKPERLELKELHRSENDRKASDRIKTILLLDDNFQIIGN